MPFRLVYWAMTWRQSPEKLDGRLPTCQAKQLVRGGDAPKHSAKITSLHPTRDRLPLHDETTSGIASRLDAAHTWRRTACHGGVTPHGQRRRHLVQRVPGRTRVGWCRQAPIAVT